MKELLVLLIPGTVITFSFPVVASAQKAMSEQLHNINQSGIKGMITFSDDGSTLTVSWVATGIDPNGVYISLVYDNGSVPGGSNARRPTSQNTLRFPDDIRRLSSGCDLSKGSLLYIFITHQFIMLFSS